MKYVEYIETDGYCWFDTGVIPNINTKIEVDIMPTQSQKENWAGFIGAQNADDDNSTFQVRVYSNYRRWSARVGDGNGANLITTNFVLNTRYLLTLDKDYFTVDGTQYSTSTTSMDTCNYSLYIGAIHNPSWTDGRSNYGRFYRVKIWESGVLVGDFRPAVDNNNNIGFYDEITSTFKQNLGTGTPIAGPDTSSISATASKSSLANTGETISIEVSCENAWTVTGNTFLTLSSTGDTGSTTITATAPSYSGATARTDTLTFTDSVTGDIAEITIRQKKYSLGQPVYLGGNEVTEIYLGSTAITEAYLGDVQVYSSGDEPTPTPSLNKTLVIEPCCEAAAAYEYYLLNIAIGAYWLSDGVDDGMGGFDVQTTYDVSNSAYTMSYDNANCVLEIVGPFDSAVTITYGGSPLVGGCDNINNNVTVTFTGNTATTTPDWTLTHSDECDCMMQGGTWDDENQECTYPEDPCISDPCSCDPNPEECYCIQNGGTWDDENQVCNYPE